MHSDRSLATGRVAGLLVAVATALALDDLSYVTSSIYDERDERGEGEIGVLLVGLAVSVIGEVAFFFLGRAVLHKYGHAAK